MSTNPLILILVGLIVGIYSGIMGLGGGTVMIPIMVLALGFSQHQAVATSLAAMIPPVTLGAVLEFYRQGHVRIATAAWIAIGILAGGYVGARIAGLLPERALRLVFGFVLVYVGGYTLFQTLGKQYLTRSILLAAILLGVSAAFFLAVRSYDLRHAPPAP